MTKIAVVLAAAVSLALASGGQAATPVLLKGETGPGFSIEVLTATGKDVKVLKPGTYRLVIEDKSASHNFRLKGPTGMTRVMTTVPFVGKKTVVLALLRRGTYTYQCDPHAAAGMKGTFKVV